MSYIYTVTDALGKEHEIDTSDYDSLEDAAEGLGFSLEGLAYNDSFIGSRLDADHAHEAAHRLSDAEFSAWVNYCDDCLGYVCTVDYFKDVFMGMFQDYEEIIRYVEDDIPDSISSYHVDWAQWAEDLGLNIIFDGRHYLLFSE